MRDATPTPSERHQASARSRWGSQRVDRLAEELAGRAGDLSAQHAATLLAALQAIEDEGDDD